MNLSNELIKEAHNTWMNNHPESLHPLDTNRFDKLALILLENDDEISHREINDSLKNNNEEWIIDLYLTRFNTLCDMYRLMVNNGYSK
jgi:hypothetical protein